MRDLQLIFEQYDITLTNEEIKELEKIINIEDLERIKQLIELFIENGKYSELKSDKTILNIPDLKELETKINYLKTIDKQITKEEINLSLSEFMKKYNLTEEKLKTELEDIYLAQEMIDSPYTNYLDEKDVVLDIEAEKVFNEILQEIKEVGILIGSEYKKAGNYYSINKIKQNLIKLITNILKIKKESDLTNADKLYIKALAITGDKKMTEKEAENLCRAVISGEKEQAEKIDCEKIELNSHIEKQVEPKNEIKEEKVVEKQVISNMDSELEKLLGELSTEDDEIAKLEREIAELERANKELEQLYGMSETTEMSENTKTIIKNIEEKLETETKKPQNKNIEKFEEQIKETESKISKEKEEVTKIQVSTDVLNKYESKLKTEKVEKQVISDSELEKMKQKLESMKNVFVSYDKEYSDREFEENARKVREEKKKLAEILQRRQEKELAQLKAQMELFEEKRKLEEEKNKIEQERLIKERIKQEAERIANEKLSQLKQKEELQSKIEKEAEILVKQKLESETNSQFVKKEVSELEKLETEKLEAIEKELRKRLEVQNQINSGMYNSNTNNSLNNGNDVNSVINSKIPDMKISAETITKEEEDDLNYYQTPTKKDMIIQEFARQENRNMQIQQNSQNISQNPSFARTMDAYYNPNQKPFFNIEDYGYILNEVNDQELKRMQMEMNEIYKKEKNGGYYG